MIKNVSNHEEPDNRVLLEKISLHNQLVLRSIKTYAPLTFFNDDRAAAIIKKAGKLAETARRQGIDVAVHPRTGYITQNRKEA
jgi:hypothetical protein